MCVDGEPSTQRHRVFKRRWWWQERSVLLNGATGVRDGLVEGNAAGKVLLIDAMSIMVRPKNAAGRGCAERARRSR